MWLAIVGGNWNNAANAGVSNWNLNNASSNTNTNIGCQTLIGKRKNKYLHFVLLTPW